MMVGRFDLLDHSVETAYVVGGVLDYAGGTVRLDQAVRSLDVTVPVAHFVLALHVVRVRVSDAVLEVIRCRRSVMPVVAAVVGAVTVVVIVVSLRRIGQHRTAEHGDEYDDQLRMDNEY